MEYVIKKFSHRFFFFTMEFILASIFTIFFYPLAIEYLDMSVTNYYLISMFILAIGGAFMDRGVVYMLKVFEEEFNQISNEAWVAVFAVNMVIYIILGTCLWVVNGNAFFSMYVPFFLFAGGWIWFFILTGYQNAKDKAEEEQEMKFITKIQRKTR